MILDEIYNFLDSLSPFEFQENWDNSGLLVGSKNDKVESICLSLDVDTSLLEKIAPNTLIITHHPLIFKGIKQFNPSLYPASLLQIMIQKNITLISMHTNFDKTHLNSFVAEKVLDFKITKQEDYFCYMNYEGDFDKLILHVKKSLNINNIKAVKAKEAIKTVALTTGSGGDLISQVKADCFISGDIKYHQALMAKENGLNLIDIGHYESEKYFGEALMPQLKNFPIKVIMLNSKNPFTYY